MCVRARLLVLIALVCLSAALPACTGAAPANRAGPSPSAGASPRPEPAPLPTRYVPTRIEKRVIELVRDAGARDVGVAEHGFMAASISATWRAKELFLLAYPTANAAIYERRREVLGETTVDGVRVLEARQFMRRQLVVECDGFRYEVTKSIGDRWDLDLMATFVVALVHSGGC